MLAGCLCEDYLVSILHYLLLKLSEIPLQRLKIENRLSRKDFFQGKELFFKNF